MVLVKSKSALRMLTMTWKISITGKRASSLSCLLYVTGLNTCYTTLEQAAGDVVTARNKVAKMLKGITTVNPSLIAAMQNVRSNVATKSDFAAACSELSEQIAVIFLGESRRPAFSKSWQASLRSWNEQPSGRRRPGACHQWPRRVQLRQRLRQGAWQRIWRRAWSGRPGDGRWHQHI